MFVLIRDKPVWERIFDHKKYLEHEGPLKQATGMSLIDVEPFPRLKLMKLYYMTLEELKDCPDIWKYKFLVAELTKFRMKVVDDNMNVRAIEEKIGAGMAEELILQAHNELRLIRLCKQTKVWEQLS